MTYDNVIAFEFEWLRFDALWAQLFTVDESPVWAFDVLDENLLSMHTWVRDIPSARTAGICTFLASSHTSVQSRLLLERVMCFGVKESLIA